MGVFEAGCKTPVGCKAEFSDHAWLWSAGADGIVRLWCPDAFGLDSAIIHNHNIIFAAKDREAFRHAQRCEARWVKEPNAITSLAYLPDGRLLSGSENTGRDKSA